MTIFKEILEGEYLTVSEVKRGLAAIEEERTLQTAGAAEDVGAEAEEGSDMPYELTRAIEHVNRFAVMSPGDAASLVAELRELDKVDEATAYKIANLLPRDRDELRALYAQERYTLSGDELDDVLNVVSKYA